MRFKTLYACTIERKKTTKETGQCCQEPVTNKCGGKRKSGKRGGGKKLIRELASATTQQ